MNETVDGSEHCANGNLTPVNCNIYNGKDFVWLNGGPATAYAGDGQYFFVVLSPGGQADPNDPLDGGKNVLSTDLHTARTYSSVDGVISYGGPHTFDSNKIRLMPYADTPNGGGVYILAICSLNDGYPVKPSSCKYDAFKIKNPEEPPTDIANAPTIIKDAAGSNDRTYTWDITKDVNGTKLIKQVGGSATFSYTVNVSIKGSDVSNVAVAGKISVFNANLDDFGNVVPVAHVTVTDKLSDDTACPVSSSSDVTLTTLQTDFTYGCSLSTLPASLDNTATVTWSAQSVGGNPLAAGSDDFLFKAIQFVENPIDECVDVTDSKVGALGKTCVGDLPAKFSYSYTKAYPAPAHDCQSFDNTGTFTTNDQGQTGTASQTVQICGPANGSGLTMGFWKGPNGNSLINTYCAPGSGKPSLVTYLAGLGTNSTKAGPFLDATGKVCKDLVTYVNNILTKASATNMNTMLRAQMLATALSVYFSDPTMGFTNVVASKVKAPSTFLLNGSLGGFTMDLTSVCPMVDNTTTGTATCQAGKLSTDAFASGAAPAASMKIQEILDFASTTTTPFNGLTSSPIWYGGDRTKQEILKNIFDQVNNNMAFAP